MVELSEIAGVIVIRKMPRQRAILRYIAAFLVAHMAFSLLLYAITGHIHTLTIGILDLLAGAGYAALDLLWLAVPRYEIRLNENFDSDTLHQNYLVKQKRQSQTLLIARPRKSVRG